MDVERQRLNENHKNFIFMDEVVPKDPQKQSEYYRFLAMFVGYAGDDDYLSQDKLVESAYNRSLVQSYNRAVAYGKCDVHELRRGRLGGEAVLPRDRAVPPLHACGTNGGEEDRRVPRNP